MWKLIRISNPQCYVIYKFPLKFFKTYSIIFFKYFPYSKKISWSNPKIAFSQKKKIFHYGCRHQNHHYALTCRRPFLTKHFKFRITKYLFINFHKRETTSVIVFIISSLFEFVTHFGVFRQFILLDNWTMGFFFLRANDTRSFLYSLCMPMSVVILSAIKH